MLEKTPPVPALSNEPGTDERLRARVKRKLFEFGYEARRIATRIRVGVTDFVSRDEYPVGALVLSRTEAVLTGAIASLAIAVVLMGWTLSQKPWNDDTRFQSLLVAEVEQLQAEHNDAILRLLTTMDAERAAALTQIGEVEQGLAHLRTDISGTASDIEQVGLVVAALRTEVIDEVSDSDHEQSIVLAQLGSDLEALSNRLTKLEALRATSRQLVDVSQGQGPRPITDNAIPFKPVGIEMWGGAMQLAVRHEGQTRFLGQGERLADWEVHAIEETRVLLSNGRGGEISLRHEGGQFSNATLGQSSLTVATNPGDARVRIMNILPVYHEGISLEPGPYDILVTKPGYAPVRKWVRLGGEDRTINISLQANP